MHVSEAIQNQSDSGLPTKTDHTHVNEPIGYHMEQKQAIPASPA